jgi:cbb3-type cytochrome oxidase cytochrome c subunit
MRLQIRADRRVGLLLAGIVFFAFVAVGATVALPAADPAVRATTTAPKMSKLAAHGLRIYRNEGCWYCHTQDVRTTPVDAAYGKPTKASSYAGLSPVPIGFERIGADLSHVGSRYGSANDLMKLLMHPPSSQMPSYDFLSRADLSALAAYLATLK